MVSSSLIFTFIGLAAAIPVAQPQLQQLTGLLGGGAGAGNAKAGGAGAGAAGGAAGLLGGGGGPGDLLGGVLQQAGVDSPIDLSVLGNPAGALGAGGPAPTAANTNFSTAKKP